MSAEVTLDIFSGRPNPSWVLELDLEEECIRRVDTLRPTPEGGVPEPPGLGYRGFAVQVSDASHDAYTIRVYKGVVQHSSAEYSDPGRRFEQWLLNSAGQTLESNLIEMVRRELEQP